ncbi:MAG TPA: hypothetical protein VGI39_03205 [Polyangiaceae bacterium]|jgi:hypothetical protein
MLPEIRSPLARWIVVLCLAVVSLLAFAHLAHAAAWLQPSPEPVGPVVRHWAPPLAPGATFLGWLLITGVVNTIAHFATPKDVDAWAERNPRVARLASIVRRAGFEPVALIQEIFGFFQGYPPPPGHAIAIGRSIYRGPVPVAAASSSPFPKPIEPPPPSGMRGMVEFRLLRLLSAPMAFALLLAGCPALRAAQVPASTLALCIADVAEQHPGLTLLEYVAVALEDCGGDALAVLDAILESDNAAVKPLQPAAQDLKTRGGEALKTFVGQVHTRIAARQAARRAVDAGAR